MVLIDADGCPVVKITVDICRKNNVRCLIVHDTAHEFSSDYAETLMVDKGADSADYIIVNRAKKGDIVITQDYGLAAMCLSKGAIPVSQNGLVYTDENIGSLLNARHFSAKVRRGGGKLKGQHKRTIREDEEFIKALTALLK